MVDSSFGLYFKNNEKMENITNRNAKGITGFILSLVSIVCIFISPGISIVLSILGIVFSSIGLSKQPKGLAIAGLVISILSFIIAAITVTILLYTITSLDGLF